MTLTTKTGLAALAALGTLALAAPDADARRWRVRIAGQGRAHVYAHRTGGWWRPYHHPRRVHVRVGGSIWVGGGYYFAEPPPPPRVYCDDPVPTYYTSPQSYAPPPVETVVAAPDPFRPSFGLGISGGRLETEDGADGNDVGLFGRLNFSRHFSLEVEIAKTEHDDGARIDRRIGASLILDLAPRARLSPYLLGGGGMGRAEVNGGSYTADQNYGEVGAGLTWRLTERFHVLGDLRVGKRASEDRSDSPLASALIVPQIPGEEEFHSARLAAMIKF